LFAKLEVNPSNTASDLLPPESTICLYQSVNRIIYSIQTAHLNVAKTVDEGYSTIVIMIVLTPAFYITKDNQFYLNI